MSNQNSTAFPIGEDVTQGQFAPEPGMSLREYAAIKLRVPDSGTDWLDAMIEKSLLNEFAGKAMQGLFASPDVDPRSTADMYARDAYKTAREMLKASKGE